MEKVARDILEECIDPIAPNLPGSLHKKLGISKEALGWVKRIIGGWGNQPAGGYWRENYQKDFLWILQNQLMTKHVAYLRKLVSFQKMENYLSKQVKKGSQMEFNMAVTPLKMAPNNGATISKCAKTLDMT